MKDKNFCKIGSIVQKLASDMFKLYLTVEITLENTKFIFLSINNDLIPFEIIAQKKTKSYVEIQLNDADTILNSKLKKIDVFLENKEFNKNIIKKEDVNIFNFSVTDIKKNQCGYVSNIYSYPMNKCVEITYLAKKYLIPYTEHYIKKIDINNETITISSITDLT